MNELETRYRKLCAEYVDNFVKKHSYSESEHDRPSEWVGTDVGDTVCIGGMFINFDDIRYDIDNDIPEDLFEKWYWKYLDRCEMNLRYMNYKSFCMGCPDPISPEQEKIIKDAHKTLIDARVKFEEAVKEFKVNNNTL